MPALVLITATVAAGAALGVCYLQGVRKPVLNGVHLLLGAATLETMAVLRFGAPNGHAVQATQLGTAVMGLVALGLFLGLTGPLMRRRTPRVSETVLMVHASVGLLAFVLFLVWASRV